MSGPDEPTCGSCEECGALVAAADFDRHRAYHHRLTATLGRVAQYLGQVLRLVTPGGIPVRVDLEADEAETESGGVSRPQGPTEGTVDAPMSAVGGDLDRYQRMADRARERRQAREEFTREELESRLGPALPGEGPLLVDPGPCFGHRTHGGGYHGLGVVCSCGRHVGCFSGCFEDGWVPPPRCTVCDARGVAHPTRLFTAGWCHVAGRGWLAAVRGIPGFNPRPLVGQQVEIDRVAYTVRGVETRAVPDVTGRPFGLLVDGEPR